MRLKSLELQGFKSFPDRTKLNFDTGMTVVIGPNGSGKSNIADAIRWVLGEISSKNIRGSKMEDVIFGGTDNRRPMGYAEVSLTFDNTLGEIALPVDYDEVTVTRKYYRSGDSEYMINGQNVRLRDINELFMNTGLGRSGYSIIGQGRISEIISKKSEDRRGIFEEAAGISKYRYKKSEAERKLEKTDDNLSRVTDILSELEGRVGPLERDAEKARKYLELYAEKRRQMSVFGFMRSIPFAGAVKNCRSATRFQSTSWKWPRTPCRVWTSRPNGSLQECVKIRKRAKMPTRNREN